MADLSDVEEALLAALIGIAYPTGIDNPSILGSSIRLYRGWPINRSLGADIAAGTCNVSVFPTPDSARNTTRWGVVNTILPTTPALTVSFTGTTARFSGVATQGQLAGVLADNISYVYSVQATDTPASVASELYNLIIVDRPCLLSGAIVTVPGAEHFVARTACNASGLQEWGRQEQGFRVSVWAPSPVQRDKLTGMIGSALASVGFLTLTDGSGGRIRYRSTATIDDARDTSLYRRDLLYDIEYGTTLGVTEPSMLFGDLVWNGNPILA